MTTSPTNAAGDLVTLAECPVGLFRATDGELCLKTEYGNNEGRIDAYIISSGEFFWGAAPQTIASQRAQMVRPVAPKATAGEFIAVPRTLAMEADKLVAEAAFSDEDTQAAFDWIDDATPVLRALAASPAHATGAAMRERIAAFLKDRDEAFVMTAEQTDAERLASADEIICLAALSSPAQEGEAAPVRTDADGVREASIDRLRGEIGAAIDATEDGTATSDPNFENMVEGVLRAVLPFTRFADDPLAALKPEGETGPAVADDGPLRKAIQAALDRVAYVPGDYPILPVKHAVFIDEVRLALTVSPSPSERDQHQGETLREAAQAVLSFREGDLPGQGWLRDNAGSRQALAQLAAALSPEAVPVADKREGEANG